MLGELDLGFELVWFEFIEWIEKFDKELCVNYVKFVMIEYNYRVFFIGCIVIFDFYNIVIFVVDYCW